VRFVRILVVSILGLDPRAAIPLRKSLISSASSRGRCKRGPKCCVSGLSRDQESSSRPSCRRIGPDRRSRFGPALGSTSSQYMLRRGRMSWFDRVSVLPAPTSSRSRRNSSMRARKAAKSSAARQDARREGGSGHRRLSRLVAAQALQSLLR
jgi:hypothetical protein